MDDYPHEQDEEGGSGFFNYLPVILWQRRWFVIVPFVLLAIAGIAAAFLLPTVYRSSATLLVESAELPPEVTGAPVTAVIDQRIAKIRQQVLSRGDLINLIEQNALYPADRAKKPLSEIVEKMRNDATISAVNADIGQKQGSTSTIAFSMSYDYPDAAKAQLVMQSFVDSFLKIDAGNLTQQATNTAEFLRTEADDLQKQIAALEGQITAIKARNGSALASAGISTVSTSGSYDAQIASLQRDNAVGQEQLRAVPKNPVVTQAEAQLAAARAVYSESHPDVIAARQRLEEARRFAANNVNDDQRGALQAQIAANNRQIGELGRLRSMDNARTSSLTSSQARAPAILEQVAQLENKATILRAQYQEVSTRLLAANNSARMNEQAKGERLSVVEPPVVPDKPYSPNRLKLIGGGLAGGLILGLLLALAVELILKPIRGTVALERLLGTAPLGIIPTLKADSRKMGPGGSGLFGRLFSRRRGADAA